MDFSIAFPHFRKPIRLIQKEIVDKYGVAMLTEYGHSVRVIKIP